MNIKKVHETVSKIKASLFKSSNSYSVGMFKSHFKGSGLQFKEHKIYTHGDDIRFIDWKLLAKMNTPYIKSFEEERNVEITVVIDSSMSMFSGYEGVSKLQASIEICCLLYLLANETKDYIHALVISDDIIDVPLNRGELGIISLVSQLEKKEILTKDGNVNINFEHKEEVTEDKKLAVIIKHLRRKREVVILSDFNDFFSLSKLNKILFKKNAHCFQVLSPLDEAEKLPYAIFSKSSIMRKGGNLKKVKFKKQQDLNKIPGKRIKKIKVQERYLEQFVKNIS